MFVTPEGKQGLRDHFDRELKKHDTTKKQDTHQLLENCKNDASLLKELKEHASEGTKLSSLPCLYKWLCRRVYGMRTDQQILEAGFNLIDIFCETKSRPELMFAHIKVTERGDEARTTTPAEQLAVRKECRKRTTDFGTPEHIRAGISTAVFDKRAMWVIAEKTKQKEKTKRCAKGCLCGTCLMCAACQVKGIVKLYKLQRYLDKHVREKHGGDSDAAPALQAAIDASSDDEKAEEKKEESEEEEEQHLQDPEPERCYCNDDDFEDMDCVQCDGCDIWFHLECLASYDNIELSIEDVAEGSWFCVKGACKEKGTQHKAEQQEKMQLKQTKAKDKREGKQRSKRGRKK